jgi:hypothetical protein
VAASGDSSTSASVLKQSLGIGDWFAGSTMTIAVIDSGIAPNADFDTRVIGTYDFTG